MNVLNDIRVSPLMNAAAHTDLKLVELLLSLGADPAYYPKSDFACALSFSIPHSFGRTSKKKKERAARIAALLIEAGAPVESPPENKQTVLMLTARENRPLHVELFLAAGADPARKCTLHWAPGWTALDHAIHAGSTQARPLLEAVTRTPPIVTKRRTYEAAAPRPQR